MDQGAFAQQVTVNEAAALKVPEGTDLAAAAGLPVAFGTAHLALVERARLRKGQTVLVLGAAGGVGTAAVQVIAGAMTIRPQAALRQDFVLNAGVACATLTIQCN